MGDLLNHFTVHWSAVLESGEILPTWPKSLEGMRNDARRIINLTTGADLDSLPDSKRDAAVRITVDLPAGMAMEWAVWGERHVPPGAWLSLGVQAEHGPLLQAAAWKGRPDEWWVTERAIPVDLWVEAVDLRTGQKLWSAD